MKKVIKSIYQNILKVKSPDIILILCDRKTKKLAKKLFEHGIGYGDHILLLEIKEAKHHGQEPEKEIARLMMKYNVQILITSKSLSHTKARKAASSKGARIITMPGITENTLKRCVDIDYKMLGKVQERIFKRMNKAKRVRVTTKLGTDIVFSTYKGKKIKYVTSLHKKGDFQNLPMGEVFASPIEGSGEGLYYVDGSHAGVGLVKKPIKITVKRGKAVKIEGGKEAKQLRKVLRSVKNKKAYNFAELGIGTNPKARIVGNILEDEKVLGTCHFALGNNASFGGKINVPIHLDGIIKKPTIYFDDKVIMKDGKLLI